MYPTLLLSLIVLLFIYSTSATSSVAYPVRDQYPLIARVGQPYSWSISRETFATSDPDNVTIFAHGLPAWLTFAGYTFSGTPNAGDEGSVNITLEANGTQDSFSLCVTHFPAPTSNIPLADQFTISNPSMSSIFPLSAGSALKSGNPAIRVPLHWSFSIGFQPNTFENKFDLFYYAQLADGSRLPSWLSFDNRTATFDGVARGPPLREGERVELVLIASDQEGYSACRVPFDLFIASHDISLSEPLVINVTAGEEFSIDARQVPWFFKGVSIDNRAFAADSVTSLSVDGTYANWVSFDNASLVLSGMAPSSGTYSLPMTLSAFNESLSLNSTIAIVPCYFTSESLPSVSTSPDTDVSIPLTRYFSRNEYFSGHEVTINISSNAFFNLTMQDGEYFLAGRIPVTPGTSHADIELSAFDHMSHATSRATLRVSFRSASSDAIANDALAKHRRLILGLCIGLGGAAGIVLLAGSLALVRKCCRVEDKAKGPYSPDERIHELTGPDLEGGGYGWSEKSGLGLSESQLSHRPDYKGGGIGFTPSLIPGSPPPRLTTKGAFFRNVKAAVRNFSSVNGTGSARKSTISKPILIFTKDNPDNMRALRAAAGLDESGYADSAPDSLEAPPGDGISLGLSSGLGSSPTSTTGHSNETGKTSIPRQRADFGPARTVSHQRVRSASHAQNPLVRKSSHARRRSTDTQTTRSSGDRERDEELAGAVIVTASRATSLHSARSSAYSYAPSAYTRDSAHGPGSMARPRLVPFNNARGVPVPVPTLSSIASPAGPREQRRVSQVAAVVSPNVVRTAKGCGPETDTDAIMTDGLRYVRAFGDQNTDLESTQSPNMDRQSSIPTPAGLSSKRSSRSSTRNQGGVSPTLTQSSYVYPSPSQSVESSAKRGSRGSLMMSRILVRTGEAFAFKYPIAVGTPCAERKLVVRPFYGGTSLPSFLAHAISNSTPTLSGSGSGKKRRIRYEVEFWGTPSTKDIGEVIVGIFTDGENMECVGRLVVEVVSRGS